MWSYLITAPLALLLLTCYLIRTNPIIKSLSVPYVNGYGILFNVRVRTLVSTIQLPSRRSFFNVVRIQRDLDNITIQPLIPFTPTSPIVLKLTYPQPGTTLKYVLNDQPQEWPYEWGTPFTLNADEGTIVLSKREKKGYRFITRALAEGKSWPLSPLTPETPPSPDDLPYAPFYDTVRRPDEINREQESSSVKDE